MCSGIVFAVRSCALNQAAHTAEMQALAPPPPAPPAE